MQYFVWSMNNLVAQTPKHIDNYILIYDLKDAGMSNLSLSQMRGVMLKTGSQFPETTYKIFVLNCGWMIKSLWAAIKPFVYPRTIEKVKFVSSSELPGPLLECIPIENIPVEFGGENEEYAQKFRT